jgi:hypothetical protein
MSGLVAFDPTEAWIRGIAGTDQLGIKEHLVASFLLAVAIFFQVFPLYNDVLHWLQMPVQMKI